MITQNKYSICYAKLSNCNLRVICVQFACVFCVTGFGSDGYGWHVNYGDGFTAWHEDDPNLVFFTDVAGSTGEGNGSGGDAPVLSAQHYQHPQQQQQQQWLYARMQELEQQQRDLDLNQSAHYQAMTTARRDDSRTQLHAELEDLRRQLHELQSDAVEIAEMEQKLQSIKAVNAAADVIPQTQRQYVDANDGTECFLIRIPPEPMKMGMSLQSTTDGRVAVQSIAPHSQVCTLYVHA